MIHLVKFEHIHLFVSGLVQGVGYRQAAWRTATSLGLGGWVRNLPDSRVEIEAWGSAEKVVELLEWCHVGPRMARVDSVEIVERKNLDGLDEKLSFEIR